MDCFKMYALPQGVPNRINLGWFYLTMIVAQVISQGENNSNSGDFKLTLF